MRKISFNDLQKFGGYLQLAPHHLRYGWITFVDEINGTVDIKWVDYPGGRQKVTINQAAFGEWNFPVVGAVVLVGMRVGEIPEILRYMTLGYSNQVNVGAADQLHPGEKLFQSFFSQSRANGKSIPVPQPTGTEIKMDVNGKVIISDAAGDSWVLDPSNSITSIESNSMDYRVITEAGMMEFGLAHGIDLAGKDSGIVFKNNVPFPLGSPLTQFRLRVLETSDLNPLTPPEVDNPFVELVLGTKLMTVEGVTLPQPELTLPLVTAVPGKEIAIQASVKDTTLPPSADGVSFKFTVDKEGNVTLKLKTGIKLKIVCDDIDLGGSLLTAKQPVVLKSFLERFYIPHTHIGNQGKPTSPPVLIPGPSDLNPPTVNPLNVVSKSTEAE